MSGIFSFFLTSCNLPQKSVSAESSYFHIALSQPRQGANAFAAFRAQEPLFTETKKTNNYLYSGFTLLVSRYGDNVTIVIPLLFS